MDNIVITKNIAHCILANVDIAYRSRLDALRNYPPELAEELYNLLIPFEHRRLMSLLPAEYFTKCSSIFFTTRAARIGYLDFASSFFVPCTLRG